LLSCSIWTKKHTQKHCKKGKFINKIFTKSVLFLRDNLLSYSADPSADYDVGSADGIGFSAAGFAAAAEAFPESFCYFYFLFAGGSLSLFSSYLILFMCSCSNSIVSFILYYFAKLIALLFPVS